jgi:hypothetical protein
MRFFVIFAFGAVAIATSMFPAHAHSLGEKTLTPPLRVEIQEAEKLAKDLANGSPLARGVINGFKLWPFGHKLSACFFDGDNQLKAFFVEVSKIWTKGTSLVIDFGSPPLFDLPKEQTQRYSHLLCEIRIVVFGGDR